MALIDETEEFSRFSKTRVTKYLNKFYEILDDREALNTKVIDRCRGGDKLLELMAKEQSKATD
jgi:hypothetical protein